MEIKADTQYKPNWAILPKKAQDNEILNMIVNLFVVIDISISEEKYLSLRPEMKQYWMKV